MGPLQSLHVIIYKHRINSHRFADDKQLYGAVALSEMSLKTASLTSNSWMPGNFIQLNQNKTKIAVNGPKQKRIIVLTPYQHITTHYRKSINQLRLI